MLPLEEIFVSKFSLEREKQFEMELETDFEFCTKKEMAEDHNMSPILSSIYILQANP